MSRLRILAGLLVGPPLFAQELLWEVNQLDTSHLILARTFGDLDGDGTDDLLSYFNANPLTPQDTLRFRVESGANGTILDDRPHPPGSYYHMRGVGDFDGDGHPDYAVMFYTGVTGFPNYVQVWSPHLDQELLRLNGPFSEVFGGLFEGHVDLDGDDQLDLLVANLQVQRQLVQAFDHSGSLLYSIPLSAAGRLVFDLLGLDDLDGDGCNEFAIGGTDYNAGATRGFIQVVSGRTGQPLRTTFDDQPGEVIGTPLASAGDLDGDGVGDYATGNDHGGMIQLVRVYSGASGAPIREWLVTDGNDLAGQLIARHDVDGDGAPDVIAGSEFYWNSLSEPARLGRVRVFSSRDHQLLMHTEPSAPGNYYALTIADLGLHQGYPVFAVSRQVPGGLGSRHLQVWRCSPPGTLRIGAGCSSVGEEPTANVRRLDTPAGEWTRLVLGSAPPGAFAWCVVAPASTVTLGGAPLPIALDSLGFPGCDLLVPPVLSDLRVLGTTGFDRGYAAIDLPLRLASTGFRAAVQWLVLDFQTFAFAASARCEFTVR